MKNVENVLKSNAVWIDTTRYIPMRKNLPVHIVTKGLLGLTHSRYMSAHTPGKSLTVACIVKKYLLAKITGIHT